jgi:hypothetical protein
MKRTLLFAMLLICFSCLTEDGANLGKSSTFLRYYNGGFDDVAQAFEETPDGGFIILATTQITKATTTKFKIKLIKTDQFGNELWHTLYPTFGDIDTSYYKGRGFLVEKDVDGVVTGFTIVGDEIDKNTNVSYLFLIKTDANGIPLPNKSKSFIVDLDGNPLENVEGQSITKASNGNYLVLASRSNEDATEDMVLAEINKDNLDLMWIQDYGAGGVSRVTGLTTHANTIYWGGTVDRGDNTDVRFVYTTENETTAYDPLTSPEFNEEIGDICFSSFGPRFAIVGTTDENGSRDILFKQVALDGSDWLFPDQSNRRIIGDSEIPEEGNALCVTSDGGALIIGNTGAVDERDYYLIKLNFQGEIQWSKVFGSDKDDTGVSVKELSDGSYVILGATTLGGLNSIMLMKTDSRGNIE